MKLGVIADTHLQKATRELEKLLLGPFRDVDIILHAGDITELAVLEVFQAKEILAVCGNMDSPFVRSQLPIQRVLNAGKFKIALMHGWGAPQGIEERIQGEFKGMDCIVYGHTHAPSLNIRDGIVFFNPGAFGSGFTSEKRSVGLLDVNDAISAQIVYL